MRKTRKYIEACKVAGIAPESEIPHAVIYGVMAARSLEWDGEKWTSEARANISRKVVKIRVTGRVGDCEIIALAIADSLALMGVETNSISGPFSNKKDQNERIYLDCSYR